MVHVGIALFVCFLGLFWKSRWLVYFWLTHKKTNTTLSTVFHVGKETRYAQKMKFHTQTQLSKTSPNSCAKCKRACVYIVPPKGWDKSTHTTPQNIEQSGPLLSLRHCALLILSAPFPSQKEHSKRTLMGRVRSKETCKSCPPKTEHTHPFAIKKETRVPKQKANAPQYLLRIGTFTTAKRPSSLKRTYKQIKVNKFGVVMILPQVHLRKPCYDFTFL